ncbi:MAG: lipoyl(octanoyl) transferase, partial [Cyclobacteriaceae bacterium]|nr:lipoyl(octanoyl) transferase [Cyclobacteriaceae bacterium]
MNAQSNTFVFVEDIGQVPYEQAWDYQAKHFNEILSIKSANRDRPSATQQLTDNYLILCEHSHVFTLGKSGDESNLLV